MATWDATADRVARAVEEARSRQEREPSPRADRAWLVRDAAERYGLGPELAARIMGDGPTEILREARGLALDRARIAAAEAEAEGRNADD